MKTCNDFLPISSNIYLDAQKNHLIEMVLLSTHNICLGGEIRTVCFYFILSSEINAYQKQIKVISITKVLPH